jgi:hypothetical protein
MRVRRQYVAMVEPSTATNHAPAEGIAISARLLARLAIGGADDWTTMGRSTATSREKPIPARAYPSAPAMAALLEPADRADTWEKF